MNDDEIRKPQLIDSPIEEARILSNFASNELEELVVLKKYLYYLVGLHLVSMVFISIWNAVGCIVIALIGICSISSATPRIGRMLAFLGLNCLAFLSQFRIGYELWELQSPRPASFVLLMENGWGWYYRDLFIVQCLFLFIRSVFLLFVSCKCGSCLKVLAKNNKDQSNVIVQVGEAV